MLLIDVIEE